MLALFVAVASCSDSSQTGPGGDDVRIQQIRDGVQLSSPISARPMASASGFVPDSELVYVSTPPHTLSFGDSVVLTTVSGLGPALGARMIDGGFDPIAIFARPNDSLDVTVLSNGASTTARMRVPVLRQPTVVRAIPARGRTDVPLNQAIEIVFSQPLDARSATPSTIQLLVNGAPVSATVSLNATRPWVVIIAPTEQLKPNTSYEIVVSTSVTDVVGSPLAAPVSSDFTTGATDGAVSTILVLAGGEFVTSLTPMTSPIVATRGAAVPFFADKFDTHGNLLTANGESAVAWSSSDTSVAVVDSNGFATGIVAGQATISACAGSVCGQRMLLIAAPGAGVQPRDLGPAQLSQMAGLFVTGSTFSLPDNTGREHRHAVLWSDARGLEDVGALEGTQENYGLVVNASGTVFGGADYDKFWLWTRQLGMVPFDLQGRSASEWFPVDISESNVVTFALPVLNDLSSFGLWTAETGFRTINPGVRDALAIDANNAGEVLLGTISGPGPCGTNAYVWDTKSNRISATLSPRDSATNQPLNICTYQVNDRGTVVGFVYGQIQRGFRWNASTGFEYLQPTGTNDITSADGINETGDVTVLMRSTNHTPNGDSSFTYTAYVWDTNNRLTLLAPLGGDWAMPIDINDSHQAFGYGNIGSSVGEQRSLIWDFGNVSPSKIATVTRTVSARMASRSSISPSAAYLPWRRAHVPFGDK